MLFCILILLILNVEAITNIVSKSEIFKPLRAFLFNRSSNRLVKFLHDLIDCPYCTSVWISLIYMFLMYLAYMCMLLPIFIFITLVVAIHRLSNILHHIIDRIDRNSSNDVFMDKENDK